MKAKKLDLDIDIIGGEGSLTPAEEKALSDFFREKRILNARKISKIDKVKKVKTYKSNSANF